MNQATIDLLCDADSAIKVPEIMESRGEYFVNLDGTLTK